MKENVASSAGNFYCNSYTDHEKCENEKTRKKIGGGVTVTPHSSTPSLTQESDACRGGLELRMLTFGEIG